LAASFEPGVGVVVSGGSPSGATAPSVDAPLWLVSPSTVWRLDAGLPSPRALHSSIFDPSRREHLLYGGIGSATVGENALGDVVRVRFLDGGHEVSVDEVDDPEGDGHPSARYSHFAGWDDARAKMVVFGGRNLARVENDVWEYSTEPHRPAMVISLSEKDIEVAGIQSFQLEVTVVAGADGELNGMPVEGVTLEIFGGGRWRPIGSMPGSVRAPQRFVFTFSTSAPRLYWGNLERLSLRLISSGRNGRSFARLFVDSVEVALRFTRP